MKKKYTPLISVIIPTYRPNPTFLRKAILSVVNQTLDNSLYEIIIVDDSSDDDEALGAFNEIRAIEKCQSLDFKFIKHENNQWLAATRTTGAKASKAKYVIFLDDDDFFDKDYLEKSLLLLIASPKADWVYTNQRKFGQRNELKQAAEFSPFKLYFRNNMSYSSLFKRNSWLSIGQKTIPIVGNVKQFEDWDMYIRMVFRGMLGTPLRDTTFNYRKKSGGLASRSIREYMLSIYYMYRSNLQYFFLLPLAILKNNKRKRKGYYRKSRFNPLYYINRALQKVISSSLDKQEFTVALNYRSLASALFMPKSFSKQVITDHSVFSLASMRSGFEGMVNFDFTRQRNFPSKGQNRTILAGHIWWEIGGAENIFWYWLKSSKSANCSKLINLVSYDDLQSSVLKNNFKEVADIQYNLSAFGETPDERLRTVWNLIDLERPKIVFISSNSYLYQLAPYIKKEFPDIKIIDILHNEFDGIVDWFTISEDYDAYLDKRIVTSNYWKEVLINKYNVSPDKIIVARNPVDLDLYNPIRFKRNNLLKTYNLKKEKTIIAFIGRLHPQKGVDVFIELAKSMNTNTKFHFIIVGDGEERQKVELEVKMNRNLEYLGYYKTVESVLAMTDILICPSLYEGAPLIGLEAAAMNTAVIAPNLVGFKEQINEGNFGDLYNASMNLHDDVNMLKSLLETSSEEIIKKGLNGRFFVDKHHSFSKITKDYETEINKLLNE